MATLKLDYPNKLERKFYKAVDGSKIYYDLYPCATKKPILLLLHGASGDSNAWISVRNILYKQGYSTLAMDLRGHGFSDRSKKVGFYNVSNIADDLAGIIKEEGLKSYVIVGHCYGANIAMRLVASKTLKGLLGLVVINTSYKTGFTDWFGRLNFLRKGFIYLSEHLPHLGTPGHTDLSRYVGTGDLDPGRIIATTRTTTVHSLFLTYDGVFSLNTMEDATKLTCPVSIIGGEKDIFFPPDTLELLHKKIKNSTLHIIPKANHILVLNNPEETTERVTEFVKTLHT